MILTKIKPSSKIKIRKHSTLTSVSASASVTASSPAPKKVNSTSPLRVWKFAAEVLIRLTYYKDKAAVGKWMKEEIANLGPAFIKLGQFISTRQGIFGKEISKELAKLQDDITQVPVEVIKDSIAKSLGRPIEEVFISINECIGSASIGQVHRAQLKTGSNQAILEPRNVAIKVQKPNVAQLVFEDLETMRNMVQFAIIIGNPRAAEFNNILTEYERFLSAELDYSKELDQMVAFYNCVKDLPVRIPRVYRSLSSKTVIVMEYLPSIKITDTVTLASKNIDSVEIANTLINVFLTQIIKKGMVHCDPHPGNIGVLEDGKTLVLYDFGNVITFSQNFKDNLSQLIFSVVQKDVNEFVELLVQLEILIIYDDGEIAEIKSFFVYFFKYLDTLDFSSLKASIVQDEIQTQFQENLRINPDFMSLFRVFSLLDGTCLKLDPNFSYITALEPYNQELLRDISFIDFRARKDLQKLTSYSRTIQSTDTNIIKMQRRMKIISDEFQQTQIFIAFVLCLEHREDILPWIMLVASYAGWRLKINTGGNKQSMPNKDTSTTIKN
jgi:predicted unusual protein kinase regulating ubiquinone biosynthesis (AarF/ABC1/UbiB family)